MDVMAAGNGESMRLDASVDPITDACVCRENITGRSVCFYVLRVACVVGKARSHEVRERNVLSCQLTVRLNVI